MKIGWIIFTVFAAALLGFVLYFGIGMSSTYPSLNEYHFYVSSVSFDQQLIDRIEATDGWSMKETDSTKDENGEICYWADLFYQVGDQKLKYDIKYCVTPKTSERQNGCITLHVVGAFDHIKKTGGYKLSDSDVARMLQTLDRTLLDGLAPACLE